MYTAEEAAQLLALNADSESEADLSVNSNASESSEEESSIPAYPAESSSKSSESESDHPRSSQLISKDGLHAYTTDPPSSSRRTSELNLFKATPGIPHNLSRSLGSPFDFFKAFITRDIMEQIIVSTNTMVQNPISEEEMWLWIAANLFLGICKSKNASIEEMYSLDMGIPFLRKRKFLSQNFFYNTYKVMPQRRFSEICSKVRFDTRATRNRDMKDDAISTVWNPFIQNCIRNYVPF